MLYLIVIYMMFLRKVSNINTVNRRYLKYHPIQMEVSKKKPVPLGKLDDLKIGNICKRINIK